MVSRTKIELEEKYGDRWRWYAVITIIVTTMATILSATSINVALPDIMKEFDLSQGEVHWLATGYLASMTITMLCATWVIDHIGMRNSTLISILLFSIISILGGMSKEVSHLFITRLVLGMIAGLMQPMAMYLIFRIFPKEKRGTVIGYYGFGVILSPALAPVIGGYLVENFNWRYIFFTPVPVTFISFILAYFFLPRKKNNTTKYSFDFIGLILLSITIAFSLDAINNIQHINISFIRRLISPILTILALSTFIWHEQRTSNPLLNVTLLMRRQFMYVGFSAMGLGFTMFGTTYLIPIFTQKSLNFSPTDAGLIMLPAGFFLGFTLLISSRLTERVSARNLLLCGMTLIVISMILLFRADVLSSFSVISIFVVVNRLGMGLMFPSVSTGSLNQLEIKELSDGSSTISFIRQLGGVYGINIIALILDKTEDFPVSYLLPLSEFSITWLCMSIIIMILMIPVFKIKC